MAAQSAALSCIDGGRCILAREDCVDAAAPYTRPICLCAVPAGRKCFHGKRCQDSIMCGAEARSCNPFVRQWRGQPVESNVCARESWPPAACSKDAPPPASPAASSALTTETDDSASDWLPITIGAVLVCALVCAVSALALRTSGGGGEDGNVQHIVFGAGPGQTAAAGTGPGANANAGHDTGQAAATAAVAVQETNIESALRARHGAAVYLAPVPAQSSGSADYASIAELESADPTYDELAGPLATVRASLRACTPS